MRRTLTVILLAVLAGACASTPPTEYYTLDMQPSRQVQAPVNISIARIMVGEALSRRDIMIKESPTRIEYYATSQWAAGLDEMVRQKLEEEFGSRVEGRPSYALSGQILAFEQIDAPGGADARVKLAIELRGEQASRHDAPALIKTYEAQKKANTERPQDVVLALSQLVEAIAAEIAADAAALQQ